jgi:hypothetical protein
MKGFVSYDGPLSLVQPCIKEAPLSQSGEPICDTELQRALKVDFGPGEKVTEKKFPKNYLKLGRFGPFLLEDS